MTHPVFDRNIPTEQREEREERRNTYTQIGNTQEQQQKFPSSHRSTPIQKQIKFSASIQLIWCGRSYAFKIECFHTNE